MPSWLRPRSASRPPRLMAFPEHATSCPLGPHCADHPTQAARVVWAIQPNPWAVVPFPFSADFQILHIMLDSICFHHVFPMLLTVFCIRKSMRAFRRDVARGRLRPRCRLPCGCGLRVRRRGPWVCGHRPAQRRQRGPRLRDQRDPRGRPPIGYGFRTIRNLRLNS